MTIVDTIIELFNTKGETAYLDEQVSQQEHALQAAYIAEEEGASDTMVVAALLHDIGHLLHGLPQDIADHSQDGRHEIAGENWLAPYAVPSVTEPMKLHVAAKRYLCITETDYIAQLSPASVKSLELQGGPFTDEEVLAFERNPYYREAVRLRQWDDRAKIPDLAVPDLTHYRAKLESVLVRSERHT
jgi:phosphonate degradation associated HDIG domain protein